MSPTSAPLSGSTSTSVSPTSADSRRRFVSFPFAARLAFFLFFLWFWGVRYGDFLYVAQGFDIFLWRWSFLTDAVRPAELSLRLSAFFVQFFYYPALGAAILAGFLTFIQFGTERLFRLTGRLFPLSFVPSALLSIQITSVEYYVFEYFDVAFLFSFVFQYSFALLFALIFDTLKSERARTAFLTLGVALSFPIFGVFALLAALFCLLKEATRPVDAAKTAKTDKVNAKRRRRLAGLALWTLAVPTLYWPLFAGTARTLGALYLAGLAEETVSERDAATEQIYAAFLGALLAYFVAVAVLDALRRTAENRAPQAVQPKRSEQPQRPLKPTSPRRSTQKARKAQNPETPQTAQSAQNAEPARPAFSLDSTATISALALLTLALGAVRCSFYTPDFAALCGVARALDREDWETVLRLESTVAAPSNPTITARVLAQARLGRLADELYLRPIKPTRPRQHYQTTTFCMCGDRILYEYGAVNPAMRVASNNYVVKRERSAWAASTLALCNVAEDRRAVAERYLYRLQGTLFHRKKAAELAAYLDARSAEKSPFTSYLRQATLSDARLAELDASFAAVRAQKPNVDDFATTRCVDHIRYQLVQTDDLAKRPLPERETRLATLLLMRDLPTFARHFDAYLAEKTALADASRRRIPRVLQEAIYLRVHFPKIFERPADERWEPPKEVELDPAIRERFNHCMTLLQPESFNNEAIQAANRELGDRERDPAKRAILAAQFYFGDSLWPSVFAEPLENY
ncbi:MAG: hypothetical protein IJE97_00265 [Thermoguttaceae bacterium]|nr:hypothetical protein [Thermoguttaceae bacterium]